jgi:hypothetical protein
MAQGPDGRRTIHLELPEMGVSGEAEVLAVSPCPPVEPGKPIDGRGEFSAA